jgi:hypothetical protein
VAWLPEITMKGTLKALAAILLLAVGGLAARHLWQQASHSAGQSRPAITSGARPADGIPGIDEAAIPAIPGDPPPRSDWMEQRSRRYAGLFNGAHCDILLVPMQVEGEGFDRPNRNIMSADLAVALASAGQCVADPYLVDIALGDGLRRRNVSDVLALARTLKASQIITVYSGHYAPGRMRVTLQVSRLGAVTAHSVDDLAYDEKHPPFLVFHEHLAELLSAVGLRAGTLAPAGPTGAMPAALPDSLNIYLHPSTRRSTTALERAAELAFLAMLAPPEEWRATDRLFSKAWVALEAADGADPAARRLRARILLHLHERPLALSLLKDDAGPEADGLRAMLNGNLPQARQALTSLHDPWAQLFLGLEVHELELRYGRDPRGTERQVLVAFDSSPYRPLVMRRLHDWDLWNPGSTSEFKELLDGNLPLNAFDQIAFRIRDDLLSHYDRRALELSALRHLHRLVSTQPQRWCCHSFSTEPSASDLLDLLDSRIEHTLGRQAHHMLFAQGLPSDALAVLQAYDPELAGSPWIEELRSQAYSNLWRTSAVADRPAVDDAMLRAARLSLWWGQAQSAVSNKLLWYMNKPATDPLVRHWLRLSNDYPMRGYWEGNALGPSAEASLPFSTDDSGVLQALLNHSNGDAHERYLAELKARFIGDPYATRVRFDNLSPDQLNETVLRAQIAIDRDNWELYRELGGILLEHNACDAAQQAILSYPPFADEHPNDPVALSGYASEWGHDLLWLGALEQARPLLRKAVDYHTNSSAEGYSAARLSLLDRRYGTAASSFLDTSLHYSDWTAGRELISLMFAAGLDSSAWVALDRFQDRYQAHGVWVAALIGHRHAAIADGQVNRWYAQRIGNAVHGEDKDALRSYAFLEGFVDRIPTPQFPSAMKALASRSEVAVQGDGSLVLTGASSGAAARLGPGMFAHGKPVLSAKDVEIPDRYATAAEALVEVSQARYSEAVSSFERLGRLYTIEQGNLSYVMPYYALAAARSGDHTGLQNALDAVPAKDQGYELILARAVLAALAGKRDQAMATLERAFHSWAYSQASHFPMSAYQYLATCTLIFEATGDDAYRQAALRLARPLRRLEPAFAFSHALVAYLSEDPSERTEALVAALYLDPASHWATEVPAPVLQAARDLLGRDGNPFSFTPRALGRLTENGEVPASVFRWRIPVP